MTAIAVATSQLELHIGLDETPEETFHDWFMRLPITPGSPTTVHDHQEVTRQKHLTAGP